MSAHANTVNQKSGVTTHVTVAGTYGDGSIYVFLADPISSCSDQARIDLEAAHTARDHVLSLGMTAATSGVQVRIHPGFCDGNTPIFGTMGESFFYLAPD
jgi:hypothetical protein